MASKMKWDPANDEIEPESCTGTSGMCHESPEVNGNLFSWHLFSFFLSLSLFLFPIMKVHEKQAFGVDGHFS